MVYVLSPRGCLHRLDCEWNFADIDRDKRWSTVDEAIAAEFEPCHVCLPVHFERWQSRIQHQRHQCRGSGSTQRMR